MHSSLRKKYIGNAAFYKMALAVAIPIMIQNGITNFVSLLDNIMVGQVGTEQMSGVAIANQLVFIFNLCIFGAVAGAGILSAQFYGSGNAEGVRDTFRFIAGYEGEIPGAAPKDCGNYLDMNLPMAKLLAGRYLEKTLLRLDEAHICYPE